MSGNGKKKQLFLFIHYSPFITIEKNQMFMFKVCRKMCVCVLFNLDCRSKSIWHLKKIFVIHKSTVALCLRLCLFFRTFYRKYAYSCHAYKKKLVYCYKRIVSHLIVVFSVVRLLYFRLNYSYAVLTSYLEIILFQL